MEHGKKMMHMLIGKLYENSTNILENDYIFMMMTMKKVYEKMQDEECHNWIITNTLLKFVNHIREDNLIMASKLRNWVKKIINFSDYTFFVNDFNDDENLPDLKQLLANNTKLKYNINLIFMDKR